MDIVLKGYRSSRWYLQYLPLHWILTKRWFSEIVWYQDSSSNFMRLVSCSTRSPSKVWSFSTNHPPSSWWGYAGQFGFLSIQGMQIPARVDFEHNDNFLIAAVSIAAGLA